MTQFVECDICAMKPGTPSQCARCRTNRSTIERLEEALEKMTERVSALSKPAVTPPCTHPEGHLFEHPARACIRCGAPGGRRVALPNTGDIVVTSGGELLVRSMTIAPRTDTCSLIESMDVDVSYRLGPVWPAHRPWLEEPPSVQTSTPAAGSEQPQEEAAGESPAYSKGNTDAEGDADIGHPFYTDGSAALLCRWCSKPQSAHPPGEIATRSGFHLRLLRRLLSLDVNIADDVVQELIAQDREIASLQAQLLRAQFAKRAPHSDAPSCTTQVPRESELFALFSRAKSATGAALDELAARLRLQRALAPPESDGELRTRLQYAISLALEVRLRILDRETAPKPGAVSPEDAEFDKALEDALEDFDFMPEPLQVYDSNSWRRVGLKRRHEEIMVPYQRDGRSDISRPKVLRAMVAAFNAMLARRNRSE